MFEQFARVFTFYALIILLVGVGLGWWIFG